MRLVFCGSYPINDLELPAEAVAQQLGQTDGGALVRKLYGHPDQALQRNRVAAAFAQCQSAGPKGCPPRHLAPRGGRMPLTR